MKIILHHKNTRVESTWAGGTSTQLLLKPENALYAKRDFNLRISIATVFESPSTFTSLHSYQRNLLLLEGCVLLNQNQTKHYLLLPGDEIHFDGADNIVSNGTCTDFNVMWQGDGIVHSQMLVLEAEDGYSINQSVGGQMLFFHVYVGKVNIEILGEKFILTQGMSLEIDAIRESLNLFIKANKNSQVILSEILLKQP